MQHASRLRATRATPPGLAVSDDARRATYAAALQQFDDLMEAAKVVGPVSRPLPLYYAVHQAGKAITAAWITDDWRVRGHGLQEDKDEKYRAAWQADVLRFRVKPQTRGVFTAVATAFGTAGAIRNNGALSPVTCKPSFGKAACGAADSRLTPACYL